MLFGGGKGRSYDKKPHPTDRPHWHFNVRLHPWRCMGGGKDARALWLWRRQMPPKITQKENLVQSCGCMGGAPDARALVALAFSRGPLKPNKLPLVDGEGRSPGRSRSCGSGVSHGPLKPNLGPCEVVMHLGGGGRFLRSYPL